MPQKFARRQVQRPPKAVVGERLRLLPPAETLPLGDLGKLIHHPDSRLRTLAEAERSRRASQRRGLARFDRVTAAKTLRHSPALAESKKVLAALPVSDATKKRIFRLLRCAPVGRFRDAPEAPRLVELCATLLRTPEELLNLLRVAEESRRLPSGTADAFAEARAASPVFARVGQLVRELELERLDSEIRGYWGRPTAAHWANLIRAVAAEIKRESPRRFWPMVADVFRPLIEANGAKIQTDAAHLRQLVDLAHRRSRKRESRNGGGPNPYAWADFLESSEFSREAWDGLRAGNNGGAAASAREVSA